ncbi:MAG: hypothetical protein ACYC6M_15485 [Terriglobales bacterium]
MTLLQANLLTAMLVGFWGRAGDGHPGPRVLAEGLVILQALVWYVRQMQKGKAKRQPRQPRRGPT